MKPKTKIEEGTVWANNALNVVQSLYSQGASPDFIAGCLATAAAVSLELFVSSKKTGVNKEDFEARVSVAVERAKMRMRAMVPKP